MLLLSGYYPGGLQDAAALAHSANGPCAPERGFPEHALLHVLGQVASAVAHLHAQDPAVAHRDVKMENVLLDCAPGECAAGRGRVVLCDFGSATTRAQVYETRGEMLEEEERTHLIGALVGSCVHSGEARTPGEIGGLDLFDAIGRVEEARGDEALRDLLPLVVAARRLLQALLEV